MVKRHRGFTLIEIIMTMIIMSIIAVVASKFMLQVYKNFITSQNISDANWQGYMALSRLADDIHSIRSSSDITTISANALTFTDVNGNSVQYQLSGTTLQRNSITLASGVQSFTLTYQDNNGATTATASAVRYINVAVTLVQNSMTTSFSTLIGTRGLS